MTKLLGQIRDQISGDPIEARVQILQSNGVYIHPKNAILKVGTGDPFFYSDGSFEVDVQRGKTSIRIERGTEYSPYETTVEVSAQGTKILDITMNRWTTLQENGWHSGNTHIHYDENELRPDDRLMLDPRVEDLRMTAISVLQRQELQYASNKYPPGMLTEFSSTSHHVQCGQETRHNSDQWEIGYGHVMILNVQNVIEPVSRGILVDSFTPDYPPLIYACDEARAQGGLVIWCHNGRGMEAPIVAALGKLDAFNLFDPYWMDPEYDIYYSMLNSGMRIPISTGSDWFLCSANRVYTKSSQQFDYNKWVDALRSGLSFITNGPQLDFLVEGLRPGSEIDVGARAAVNCQIEWKSHYPINSVELIVNGSVAHKLSFHEGSKDGRVDKEINVSHDSWFAVRVSGNVRDSFAQPIFAHTSPIYVNTGIKGTEAIAASKYFIGKIDESLEWVKTKGRFYSHSQRKEIIDIFKEGQQVYKSIALP
tara:strand:+ start:789 stop:2228 length:1440 start_codon:yes stop_codon:yes gene_type:complete